MCALGSKKLIEVLVYEEIRLLLRDHYPRRSITEINKKALALTSREVNLTENYLREYFDRAYSEPTKLTKSFRRMPRVF